MAVAVEGRHGIVKTGFLASRKKYWCALSRKDTSLYYFAEQQSTKPEGRISLGDAVALRHVSEPAVPDPAKRYGFRISTAKGVDYVLFEPSGNRDELNAWLQVMHAYVGKQWELAPADVSEFGDKFDLAAQEKGVARLSSAESLALLTDSGLSPDVLGEILALADRDGDKHVNKGEFTVAMGLIRGMQKGWQLPAALPDPLVWCVWEEERGQIALIPKPSANTPSGSDQKRSAYSGGRSVAQTGHSSSDNNMEYGSMPDPTAQSSPYSSRLSRSGSAVPPPADGATYSQPLGDPAARNGKPNSPLLPPSRGLDNDYGALPSGMAGHDIRPSTGKDESTGYGSMPSSVPGSVRSSRSASQSAPGEGFSRWVECAAPDGRTFYYDEVSKTTTWDAPQEDGEAEKTRRKISMAAADAMGLHLPLDSAVTSKDVGTNIVLDAILDPAKCEFLRTFLSDEGTNAELLFYLDCVTWSGQLPPNKVPLPSDVEKARAIFDTYMSDRKSAVPGLTSAGSVAGQAQVGVSKAVKANIKKALRRASVDSKRPEPLPAMIFAEAMREVLSRMQSEQFPKFMKSMVYLNMFNSIASKSACELPEALWDEFVRACDGGDDEGWHTEGNKSGVLVETKSYAGDPLQYVRGSAVVPLSPEDVYKFACSSDLRGQWELLMLESRVLERLDDRTVVSYIAYRPPKWAAFLSNFDFVVLRTERRLDDGTILVLSRSVVHSDAPERKGYNRGEMYCGGFCIRSAGPSKSTVIYVNQARIHGIPKWAEKKHILKRALILKKIRSFAEKQLKNEKTKGTQPAWRNPQLDVNRSVAGRERQASRTSKNL